MQRYITLLLALALFLNGCNSGGSGGIPDSSEAFKGSDGLVMSFFSGAPPEKTLPGYDFKVAVLLENKGATDIICDTVAENCGYFVVFANEPISEIKPNSGKLKEALQNDGQHVILGKESYLSGGKAAMELSAKVNANAEKTTLTTITVDACYPYKTVLTASICVRAADYTVEEGNLVCEPRTLTFSSQGAPVAIKKIEQDTIFRGSKVFPRLKIFVQDVGKGTIVEGTPASLAMACTRDSKDAKDLNNIIGKITIDEATLSGQQLDCGKSATITGVSKNDYIECISKDGFDSGSNNFISPLILKLSYGYQTAISTQVEVEVLDTPPNIRRFEVTSPYNPKLKQPIRVYIQAEDDLGLKSIELKGEEGNIIGLKECDDKLLCENSFEFNHDFSNGLPYTVKASVFDNNKERQKFQSKSAIILPVFPPEILTFDVPATTTKGTNIVIKAIATDDKEVAKLEVLDRDGKLILSFKCPEDKKCEHIFEIKAPAEEGKTYAYKLKATDSEGLNAFLPEAEKTFQEGKTT